MPPYCDTMHDKPVILHNRTIAQTRIFHIEEVGLRFSNGTEACYERMLGPPQGAVLIIPMLDNETVLLIREYAVGVERYELGLPKGRIEQGEDILSAANREIMEEIGYAASELEHIHSLSLAPGYVGHHTHVVLARGLYPQERPGDEPEPIEVVPWSLHRIHELIQREDCSEARSIAALYMTRERLFNAG